MNMTVLLMHLWLAAWAVSDKPLCAVMTGFFVCAFIYQSWVSYRLKA